MAAYRTAEGLIRTVASATRTDEDRWDIDWVLDVYESSYGMMMEQWYKNHKGNVVPSSWFRTTTIRGNKNKFPITSLATVNGINHISVKGTKGCTIKYIFTSEAEYCNAQAYDCKVCENCVVINGGQIEYKGSNVLDRLEVTAVWATPSELAEFNPMFDDFPMDTALQNMSEQDAVKMLLIAAKGKPDVVSDGHETTITR